MKRVLILLTVLAIAAPAEAQFGKLKGIAEKGLKTFNDMNFTDQEEQQLGAEISAQLRNKYGVVQDRAAHKYVTLAGAVLASASTRPTLPWTFIVLDTDGVNAFAAPGGFIHITRGALALIQNEAELAGVLGHEMGHVTLKHTINAIKKAKAADLGSSAASRNEFIQILANKAYELTLENAWDRDDEYAADKVGLGLANKAGYSPAGLSAFLTKLAERNKGLSERSGIFASHPAMTARLGDIAKLISSDKLTASATVAARYSQSISFKPVPVSQVAQVAPPSGSSAPAADSKSAAPKSGGGAFGLGGMNPLGREKSSGNTIASAGSRGVNPDRDARGGPNKGLVAVTVTAAEIGEFRKGIAG
jgi:predicted Zn-dependent protease